MAIKNYEKSEIIGKVNEILIEKLCLDVNADIEADKKLTEDLGADSLDNLEIVMAIEHEFEISISDAELDSLNNAMVADLYKMVEDYLNAR